MASRPTCKNTKPSITTDDTTKIGDPTSKAKRFPIGNASRNSSIYKVGFVVDGTYLGRSSKNSPAIPRRFTGTDETRGTPTRSRW